VRGAEHPLVPRGALRATPAWGSVLVSFFVGAALIAAVVDIPLFARTTIYRDSQLDAALVLVRFLLALPVGAVIGGYLTRKYAAGVVTAAGMTVSAGAFLWMTTWKMETLHHFDANIPLVLCGFGFGLALPPINAAILASTDDGVHGLASAFVVVGRMVGMLVGISALTAIGLRRFYAGQEKNPLPPAREVCDGRTRCKAFSDLLAGQGIPQEHAVFAGAAVCAVIAGVLAVLLFRGVATRGVSAADLLRSAG
jgi:MFS family permease